MELFNEYLKVILDWLVPLFKVVAVGTVGGVAAMGLTERVLYGRMATPRVARMVSTGMACGFAWLINYSNLMDGFGAGPRSWTLVLVAGVLGSYIAEAVHDNPPSGLGWLKRKTAEGGS